MFRSTCLAVLALTGLASAETGIDAWLRYARIPGAEHYEHRVPGSIVALNNTVGSPVYTAAVELYKGIEGIFGKQCTPAAVAQGRGSVTVGTVTQFQNAKINVDTSGLIEDGYYLNVRGSTVTIVGQNERGALYGAFKYLSLVGQGNVTDVSIKSNPSAPIRWTNEWNNLQGGGTHGSVERGYGGPSIFWENGTVKADLTRVAQYARILASIGINAAVVNNVNSNETFTTPRIIEGFGKIADAMRPYGVQVGMSPLFSAPYNLKQLDTFDPLNATVRAWWADIANKFYARIPDFAGMLVKANSEGQPGPLTYNRTLADGANMFAEALAPHGGILVFRAFVYDYLNLNQSNWKADRANAAVEAFTGLDGAFDDNVVVQVKYGPIDFQVREPASPLFSYLKKTNLAIELQISQEYLGQQAHLVYLANLWHSVTDFDLRMNNETSYVRDIVSTRRGRKLGGFAGVSNVGTNQTWYGSHLAQSNLYAFGRLAWNPLDDAKSVLQEWTRLTFGFDEQVMETVTDLSLESWPTYENYSGNLGVQTLTDILNAHYGPNPSTADGNPWGQWTRADANGIGMDRTVWNGTGNAGQYEPEVHAIYENIETTPDNLLLWFHHVPYTHILKSGISVIQHFYNAHYYGAANAQTFAPRWAALKGKIDSQRFEETLYRLKYQAGHSLVWRDTIVDFYHNESSIADEQGRVGVHPYRIEAEDMQLDGYKRYAVSPWNTASKGYAIVTVDNSTTGTATTTLSNTATGVYDLAVNFFDVAVGRATWELYLNNRQIGTWRGDADGTLGRAPIFYIDGQTATRITFPGVSVTQGDVLRVVGKADAREPAPLDYISILPQGVVD